MLAKTITIPRRVVLLACLMLLAGGLGVQAGPAQPAAEAGAAAGEYLIGYEPGTSAEQRAATIAAAGGRLIETIPALAADLVEFPA
ncbi:MAG TPA: hypothetical protein PKD53_18795, partial [Chloroflexaceae bacterium]|nr:hypothetical protein [Chloroflexaceae bacterium]